MRPIFSMMLLFSAQKKTKLVEKGIDIFVVLLKEKNDGKNS